MVRTLRNGLVHGLRAESFQKHFPYGYRVDLGLQPIYYEGMNEVCNKERGVRMKNWYTILMVLLAGFFVAGAALTEDEMESLEDYVNLAAINDDDYEDENEVEYFELTFRTNQRGGEDFSKFKFMAKAFIELKDKKTDTVCHVAVFKEKPSGGSTYTGTDEWRVLIPYGEMHRPKMEACVVQYGVMDTKDGEPVFVPIVEDFDDAETIEELLERTPELEDADVIFQHKFELENSDGDTNFTEWK